MIRVTSEGGQDQVQLFLAQIIKVRVIVEAEESLKNGSIRVLQIMGDQSLDLNLNPFLHKRERLRPCGKESSPKPAASFIIVCLQKEIVIKLIVELSIFKSRPFSFGRR